MRFAQLVLASLVILAAALPEASAQITAARVTPASKNARAGEAEFRALYKELVEINTTLSAGSCTEAVTKMKARLAAAGYPESDLHLVVPPNRPKDGNLVAILPGSDAQQKALLLLARPRLTESEQKQNNTENEIVVGCQQCRRDEFFRPR